MSRRTVLVIEDELDIRELVRVILERAGMDVIEATTGSDGLRAFYERKPHLVILDIGLPDFDGWHVLERIRELSDVCVLMLTARATEMEKVRGLRGGADDYLTKPFGRQELVARIEALLRRGGGQRLEAERHDDGLIEIDFDQRHATALKKELGLTPTEFKLLGAFVRHPNQVLTHDQLLEMVWGDAVVGSPNQVKLYVGYLRRKLRKAAGVNPIETLRGFGYRYNPAAREEPSPGPSG
jgi:DNA-binding response OmpR family regulator